VSRYLFGILFPDEGWTCGSVSVENFVHVCFRGHQRSKRGGVLGAESPPFFADTCGAQQCQADIGFIEMAK
jgi:hypothetical protein